MRITSRRKTIAFFLTLGVGLTALALAVGSGWIIVNWREGVKVFLGFIFFCAIAAGIILNTIFLVARSGATSSMTVLLTRSRTS